MRWNRIFARVAMLVLGLAIAGTAQAQTPSPAPACDYQSVKSPPGRIWWAQERWRYANDDDAGAAYAQLVTETSPWPDWFLPRLAKPYWGKMVFADPLRQLPSLVQLPAGTRIQMAMEPTKTDNQPGGWGTFDNITSVAQVRHYLAVTIAFKKNIDRVVVYKVIKSLPAWVGPVGPQVDGDTCSFLPGRWSQVNLAVAPDERIQYLEPIGGWKIE